MLWERVVVFGARLCPPGKAPSRFALGACVRGAIGPVLQRPAIMQVILAASGRQAMQPRIPAVGCHHKTRKRFRLRHGADASVSWHASATSTWAPSTGMC